MSNTHPHPMTNAEVADFDQGRKNGTWKYNPQTLAWEAYVALAGESIPRMWECWRSWDGYYARPLERIPTPTLLRDAFADMG